MAKMKSKESYSISKETNEPNKSNSIVNTVELSSLSEEKWKELLQEEEEDNTYFKVMFDAYKNALCEEKKDHIKRHLYTFIVMCCHIAWTKIINMYFQRHDPGECSETFHDKWKADEEPLPSPLDSWASHCIPVVPQATDSLRSSFLSTEALCVRKQVPAKTTHLKASGIPYSKETYDIEFDFTEEQIKTGSCDGSQKTVIHEPSNLYYPVNLLSLSTPANQFANKNKEIYFKELDKDKRKLFELLLGKEQYQEFSIRDEPIPIDLIELLIESIPEQEDTDENRDFSKIDHDFNEEDKLGFCYTEELEFSEVECSLNDIKPDAENVELPKIYQKYKTDPVILDERNFMGCSIISFISPVQFLLQNGTTILLLL